MANTITGLLKTIYSKGNLVSRESVGMVKSVARNVSEQEAAKGQYIDWPVVPQGSASDVTPAPTVPSFTDTVHGTERLQLNYFRRYPWHYTNEEAKGMMNSGTYITSMEQQLMQGLRTLTNEIEGRLAGLYINASRAYGTAGTNPFASDVDVLSEGKRILIDNGAPQEDLHCVFNSAAGAKLRNQGLFVEADKAGTDSMARTGNYLPLWGISMAESSQIKSHTAGTAASATTDNTGYAIGSTDLALASAGTGTILEGDIIKFAGDGDNKYLIADDGGDADVSGGGTITLNEPGLQATMSAAAKAITLESSYTANLLFSRDAFVLGARVPAKNPTGRDLATDFATVQDPMSGLTYALYEYAGYHGTSYELCIVYGIAKGKSEHAMVLIG